MRFERLGVWLVLVLSSWGSTGLRSRHAVAAEQHCDELGAGLRLFRAVQHRVVRRRPRLLEPGRQHDSKECSAEPAVSSAAPSSARPRRSSGPTTRRRCRGFPPLSLSLSPATGVTRFLTANNNHEGTFAAGNGVPPSAASFVRLAARWYVYHSPNFAFKTDSASPCQNTKIMEFDADLPDRLHGRLPHVQLSAVQPGRRLLRDPGPAPIQASARARCKASGGAAKPSSRIARDRATG